MTGKKNSVMMIELKYKVGGRKLNIHKFIRMLLTAVCQYKF